MTISRTPNTVPNGDTAANLSHIANALAGDNSARAALVDRTDAIPQVGVGSTSAGNRGLDFILTVSAFVRMLWNNVSSAFEFVDQSGVFQKISFGSGTTANNGVTFQQQSNMQNTITANYQAADTSILSNLNTFKTALHLGQYTEFSNIDIESGTGKSVTHGLGHAPVLVFAFIVCQVAEYGYLVNQEIPINTGISYYVFGSTIFLQNHVLRYNSTTIFIDYVNSYILPDLRTGQGYAQRSITEDNWKLRLKVLS